MQPQPGWHTGPQHQQPRPTPPPYPYAPPGPPAPPRGRRLGPIILAAVLGGLLLIAAVGAGAWFLLTPEKIVLTGGMLLRDDDLEDGERCWGVGGYSDIREGTQVTVTDEAGTVLAVGNLGPGTGNTLGCRFEFTVEVEGGHAFYGFEVSRRGVVRYPEADIRDGVELSIGN